MAVFIALLRAINATGTGMVPMKELKAACEAAGLKQVSTYIASGNIVFSSGKSAATVKGVIAGILRDRFSLTKNHTMIRTPDDLAKVIARNPFTDAAADYPNWLLVNFLDARPPATAAKALGGYAGSERLHLDGIHLYIDYTGGVGRSKVTPAFLEKTLQVPSTGRNWNTTAKLLAMARAIEP